MNQPALWIAIGVGLVAVFGIAIYLLRNHPLVKGSVKGPLGFGAQIEADHRTPGGSIGMEAVKAKVGSVEATTGVGGNIGMKDIEAGQNVKARTNGGPPKN